MNYTNGQTFTLVNKGLEHIWSELWYIKKKSHTVNKSLGLINLLNKQSNDVWIFFV